MTRFALKYTETPQPVQKPLEEELRARIQRRLPGEAFEKDRQEILSKIQGRLYQF